MFEKKWAVPLLFPVVSLGMLTPAYADIFDNTWFEARITAIVKKGEGFEKNTLPPYRTTNKAFKADSGKSKCYVHIAPQINRSHEVVTLCKDPSGWKKTKQGQVERLDELELGNDAIAHDRTALYFAANNQSYQDSSIDFEGEIILKPILNLDGTINSTQLITHGLFYVYDNTLAREVHATASLGTLVLKYAFNVPNEVITCLNDPLCI